MTEDGKRAYVSTLREDQARRTRRQIVDAAGRLFARQGFAATTMDAIAEEAGVSRKTVFTSVGGKVALLKLAYDYALAGDDEPVPMIERPGLQGVIAEPDPYEQLRLYAAFVAGNGERIGALWLALRGAAEVDDEARELYGRWERERLEAMRDGPVPDLVAKGALRPDLTTEEAAAILWVLVHPALYHRLVVEAGWSRARFQDWLYEAFLGSAPGPAHLTRSLTRKALSRLRPGGPSTGSARAACGPSTGSGRVLPAALRPFSGQAQGAYREVAMLILLAVYSIWNNPHGIGIG